MKNARPALRSITVNGRFLSQPITGVQRYAYELLSALDILLSTGALEPIPVTVLVPKDAGELPFWSWLRVRKIGHFTGQLWEQFDLPLFARGSLLFTPCGGAPLTHKPQVITIHDAGPFSTPEAYSGAYRNYYKTLQKILSHTAAHVITVSEFSRQELITHLRIPGEKISYTWLSGEHIFRCDADDAVLGKNALSPGRFVFAVGSKNSNKNLRGLIQASAQPPLEDVCFAIAGGSNGNVFADAAHVSNGIKDLGFVTDGELRALYEHAACFVFPSFYEGFGLPPLEALTVGCPVVVSCAGSLPEVFGNAAVYCDPHSPEDIAKQISRVLRGEHGSRDSLIAYAGGFTWQRCARDTWSILLRAIDGG